MRFLGRGSANFIFMGVGIFPIFANQGGGSHRTGWVLDEINALRIIERGVPQAYLRSRTCVKHNAVFGARFKGLSLYFLYQKRESATYQNGLDTYLIRIQTCTPPLKTVTSLNKEARLLKFHFS